MKEWDKRIDQGGHDPNHPHVWNQLMISINNPMLNFDRKVEMGILALRQRRRFMQVRKLGIKVPLKYKRIRSVKHWPNVEL